jgi:hypothetical protein
MRHLYLSQPEKSTVAEHVMDIGHNIKFNTTCRKATNNFGSHSERSYRDLVTYKSQQG